MRFKNRLPFTLFVLSVIVFPIFSQAATLLSDDFTGTTIDTVKWNENDSLGIGGTTGNIRQNNNLSVTGTGAWGGVWLVTDDTYDRTVGTFSADMDVTISNCASGSSSIPGIGYGDPGVLTGGGQSYTMYYSGGQVFFSRQNANNNAQNVAVANSTCTNNVPFHVKIEITEDLGAKIYLNNSPTAGATLSGGTFTNKGFFISAFSGTIIVDNLVISGPNLAAPDAPSSIVVTPSNNLVSLSFSTPQNNGSPITDYIVEYKLSSSGTWSTFSDTVSTSTSINVTGLVNGSSYDFRVSAVNSIGTSSPSNVVTATPNPSTPSQPQSLSSTSGVSSQISLTWTAPSLDGGSTISDYLIEYKLTSEPTNWTVFNDGTSSSLFSYVTGLVNGSSYDFRVSAVNSMGTGSPSSSVTATPNIFSFSDDFTGTTIDTAKWVEVDSAGTGGSIGNVRQNGTVTVTGIGSWVNQNGLQSFKTFDRTNGDVSLTVTIIRSACGSGSGPVAIGYGDLNVGSAGTNSYILTANGNAWELYYWNNGASVSGPVTLSGFSSCTNGEPFTLTLRALQGGGASVYVNNSNTPSATMVSGSFTNKSVWVGALNSSGTSQYDNLSVVAPLTAPNTPSGFSASPSNSQVTVSWTEPFSNGSPVTDYIVEYKLSSSSSWTVFNDGVSTSTSAVVNNLANGVNYNFRVSSVNANGTSDPSSVLTLMPVSSDSTAPTASSVSINGSPAINNLLVGRYTYNDVNGNSEANSIFRWLISDTLSGTYTPISGANSIYYTPTSGNQNKYLKFEVTPISNSSPTNGATVVSSPVGPVGPQVSYMNLIVSTGQSLSIGINATPSLTTTQPYSNVMLTGNTGGMGTGASLTPLIEGGGVEKMSSGMANTITANAPLNDYQIAVALHGVSGYPYSQLKKGTGPYNSGMSQITSIKNAATALGKPSRVVAVTTIHGETDNYNNVSGPTYQGFLEEWQRDYEADAKAITGQTENIPLFTDQMSSFMATYAYDATSEIPIYQLKASEDNPGLIYLVTPKYFFNYSDLHHLTGASSRWLGEYYGKVIKKVLIDREVWRPLSPESAIRVGNEIYVDFHVPSGNLVFDTTLEPLKANYGFEYYDASSSASITSVSIVDSNTVKVTLSGVPNGNNQRIRYAYTGVVGADSGSSGAARGNLRDTDTYPSLYGNTLYNWSVHFDEPITIDASAPSISSVIANPSSNSAVITWLTNEDSSSIVDYGLTSSYGTSTTEIDVSTRITSHSVSVSGLLPCTDYSYRVRSRDLSNNIGVGSGESFTTTGCTGSAAVLSQNKTSLTSLSGGSLSLISNNLGISISVPANATQSDIVYQVKSLNPSSVFSTTGYPSGFLSVGNYTYDLRALSGVDSSISSFSLPIQVTIYYQDSDVLNINESSLIIHRYDGNTWNALSSCSVNVSSNSVSCLTSNFSVFSVFGTPLTSSQSISRGSFVPVQVLNISPIISPCLNGDKYNFLTGFRCTNIEISTSNPDNVKLNFSKNLSIGNRNSDVLNLQKMLNNNGYKIAQTGPGSPGKETNFFGRATFNALVKFQKEKGIRPASGFFGPITRAFINSMK